MRPAPRDSLARIAHAALIALASLVAGCIAKLPDGATALDAIDLKGTDAVDESDLLAAIASTPSPKALGIGRLWWVDYGLYDSKKVEGDLRRIELAYVTRGYREARVRAGRVLRTGERSVKVEILVDEGTPIRVTRVVFDGLAAVAPDVGTRVTQAFVLSEGNLLDEPRLSRSVRDVTEVLTDAGHAHATVTSEVNIDARSHTAMLHVYVKAGPLCTFGDLEIKGTSAIEEREVRRVLGIDKGERYSTRRIRMAEHTLSDLELFDDVSVEPMLEGDAQRVVPLHVRLKEGKLQKLRIEPDLVFDPVRDELRAKLTWEHRNFLGGMRKLSLSATTSFILENGYFDVHQVRPGWASAASFRQPGVLEGRVEAVFDGSYGVMPDPVDSFYMASLRGAAGLDRRFGDSFYAGVFYRRAMERPVPFAGADLPANAKSDQIALFELTGRVDTRDDKLRPRHGWLGSLSLQWSVKDPPGIGGSAGDLRVKPELAFYGSITRGVVLAYRFMAGFLMSETYDVFYPGANTDPRDPSRYAYDPSGAGEAPFSRAFFSGGQDSNRGYPLRWVGLRDCGSTPGGHQLGQGCSVVVGGASIWESSLELRFDIVGQLSGVIFADMSDVSRKRFDLRIDHPHLSIGPGLRFRTPVGLARLDFGIRVPGAQAVGGELDARERAPDFSLIVRGPYALHLSMGEVF